MGNLMGLLDPLKGTDGGRVLDVGTGQGRFIGALLENLAGYTEIIGIDTNAKSLEAARQAFPQENIRFIQMDACKIDFPSDSFDTVSIANAIHHCSDPQPVFQEIRRVLKPGGKLILCEYYCDEQNEAQLTHVYIHHWGGAIDRQCGEVHNPTFTRRELVQTIETLGFGQTIYFDYTDFQHNPLDPELRAEVEQVIDSRLEKAADLPNCEAYRRQGEVLRQRLHTVGFQTATQLVAVCRK